MREFKIKDKVLYEDEEWQVVGYKLDPNFYVIRNGKLEETVHSNYLEATVAKSKAKHKRKPIEE